METLFSSGLREDEIIKQNNGVWSVLRCATEDGRGNECRCRGDSKHLSLADNGGIESIRVHRFMKVFVSSDTDWSTATVSFFCRLI